MFHRHGRDAVWPRGHHLSRAWFQRVLLDFTFWFFIQGKGRLLDHRSGASYPLKAGVCLCMKPGMDLEVWQDDADPLGDAFFHLSFLRGSRLLPQRRWPACPFYTEVAEVSFFDQTTRRILALLNRRHLPGHVEDGVEGDELVAGFLMKGLLTDLIRTHEKNASDRGDRYHEKVISTALTALYEEPRRFRNVDDLARASGYSGSHFRHLCRKVTGERPSHLLIKARIERARHYLSHSELTIGAIADALGYENVYYFSRQFRLATGMTASRYRRDHG